MFIHIISDLFCYLNVLYSIFIVDRKSGENPLNSMDCRAQVPKVWKKSQRQNPHNLGTKHFFLNITTNRKPFISSIWW